MTWHNLPIPTVTDAVQRLKSHYDVEPDGDPDLDYSFGYPMDGTLPMDIWVVLEELKRLQETQGPSE